jgi:hypothetical protein
MSLGTKFKTDDGYTLTRTSEGWSDGDMLFYADPQTDLPVDADGTPLDGEVVS